ncbi:MAG: hypothetical protein GTO08_03175, partial [Deltaproteobacteria bacterium]|nr:hypothetical protein [Deltaproteobacteria bacterium]
MEGKKYTLLFMSFFMVFVLFSASAAADTDEYDIEMFREVFSEIIKDPTIAGMIGNERINIFVDDEIKGHIITQNSELVETGEDELDDATLNVYVGSETIQDLIDEETTFLDAFREGKIRLEGVGFFNALRFAIAQFLFNLYSFFGGVSVPD